MDKENLQTVSAVALNSIFGYEPELSNRIINSLGSPEALFALSEDELQDLFGPGNRHLPLICGKALDEAAELLHRLLGMGYQVLSIQDENYPKLLKECPDAPAVLFVRSGTDVAELFNSRPAVSIVGTRDITPYGNEWCTRIVRRLSEAPIKPLIISGMAIGIDICAHMASLAFGLPTTGVLPVGIDNIYPRRHSTAADKICSTPGCAMVTDFPPGTVPEAFTFLRRNRIIAGMSRATILVESKEKGGGTMTARLASGYGRDVFVLPGRIDDLNSRGCNRLLSEKLAEALYSLDALPELLGLGKATGQGREADKEQDIKNRYSESMEPEEMNKILSVFSAIKRTRGLDYEGICRECRLEYSEVTAIAGRLENDGFIVSDLLQRCSVNAFFY